VNRASTRALCRNPSHLFFPIKPCLPVLDSRRAVPVLDLAFSGTYRDLGWHGHGGNCTRPQPVRCFGCEPGASRSDFLFLPLHPKPQPVLPSGTIIVVCRRGASLSSQNRRTRCCSTFVSLLLAGTSPQRPTKPLSVHLCT
jgi:hypothetical protein